MASTESTIYGSAKTYEVTWMSGRTERVQAHWLDYPSINDNSGAGHIKFRLYIDGKTTMMLSVSQVEIKLVRFIPDSPVMVTKTVGFRSLQFEQRFLDRARELLKCYKGLYSPSAAILTSEMGLCPHVSSLPYDILGIAERELRAEGYKHRKTGEMGCPCIRTCTRTCCG